MASILDLLGERSQANSYVKHLFGLYLYTSGAQRQVISVLNSLGKCSSYPALAGTQSLRMPELQKKRQLTFHDHEDSEGQPSQGSDSGSSEGELPVMESEDIPLSAIKPIGRTSSDSSSNSLLANATTTHANNIENKHFGLLRRISLACRISTKSLAQSSLLGHVYDNINMVFKVAEQVVGRTDSQENGTCATVFPLYGATDEDMQTANLLASLDAAPLLSIKDIDLTKDESALLRECLIHTILRIIVDFGGTQFTCYKADVAVCTPVTSERIPVHKTDTYPLPAKNIDESSITGNAEVIDTIFQELGYNDTNAKACGKVKIVHGDQLSVSRIRSVSSNRVGHEGIRSSYLDVVCGPGLFHAQIHAIFGTLQTHWGNSSLGHRDPGSLTFHNSVLFRKPITLTSLPPYRTCCDLVFVSLYARILHCLELISGTYLDRYVQTFTFQELQLHATAILDIYANSESVQELQTARANEVLREELSEGEETSRDPWTEGDTIYENALLFMRDALHIREFTDVIKVRDSGRIVIMLKRLALLYRGTGRTKYAHEMLHLIHNVTHVWPKPLRYERSLTTFDFITNEIFASTIILNNWLVNPTGRANSFLPVDLLQEHMNFWVKVSTTCTPRFLT